MKILLVEDDVNLREVVQRSDRYPKNRGLYLRLHFAGYNVA